MQRLARCQLLGFLRQPSLRRDLAQRLLATIKALSGSLDLGGRRFTREEMNERKTLQ
jgi:hypothetical protein